MTDYCILCIGENVLLLYPLLNVVLSDHKIVATNVNIAGNMMKVFHNVLCFLMNSLFY